MSFHRAHRANIKAIKSAVVRGFDPDAIILFGSQARGDADEFSDIDLIVVAGTPKEERDLAREILASVEHIAVEKHVIVRSSENFFRQRDVPGAMVFPAAVEGKVIYARDGFGRSAPEPGDYGPRKAAVVDGEYVGPARDYLARAQFHHERGHLFRSRDMTRFAAIKALKGIFVKHDLHPPRELDVALQQGWASELEPDLAPWAGFAEALNTYCPETRDPERKERSSGMLGGTVRFIDAVLELY